MTHRYFQDALPTSPSVSRLRALGVVDRNRKSVVIAFDEALRREVGVTHRQFPNGGSWSFFTCPQCERRARVLKVHYGAVMCWRGAVTRTEFGRTKIGSPSSGSGRGSSSPRSERFLSEDAERAAGDEMALDVESVLDCGVNGQEALG
jgi:hypothetical protein